MKVKVLLLDTKSRPHKVVHRNKEVEPIQNSDRLFYYVTWWERDGNHHIDIVYKIEELYVFGYSGYLKDLDQPKNIQFLESWRSSFLSSIAQNNCPSLLDIRVYQELGLDCEEIINQRRKFLLEDANKNLNVEDNFVSGETITGCDFVKLCFYKKIKVPQDVLEIAGWKVAYIDRHTAAFKKGVDIELRQKTLNFIIRIRNKLITARTNDPSFIKYEDVLGNSVYWINGIPFESLDEGERACGVFINPDYRNKSSETVGNKFICEVRSRHYRKKSISQYFKSLKEAKAWGLKEYRHMMGLDNDI